MPKLTPTDAQEEAIQSIMHEPTHAALVASTTGAGKTLLAVEALKRLDVRTVLVIIPLNTIDSWKATFANQWPDFPVYTVTAKKPEDFSRLQKGERGAYLIGREFFKIAATDLWHKKQALVNGKVVEVDDKDRPPKREKRWDYKSINRHLDAVCADEALALTTPVLSERGWTTIGELSLNDRVFGTDGKLHAVTHLFPIREQQTVYEITFNSGQKIVADAGHKWVACPLSRSVYLKQREVTTQDMFDRGTKWAVPYRPVLYLPEADLPVDPYVLGQWLGNGNANQRYLTTRTEMTDDIMREYAKRGYETHLCMWRPEATDRVSVVGFEQEMREYLPETYRTKEFPRQYLRASAAQRLDLLRGLMDSDGYVRPGQGGCVFVNTNLSIIHGVESLAKSLGFDVNHLGKVRDNDWTTKTCYRLGFQGTQNLTPFLLRGTKEYRDKKNKRYHYITSIQKVESVPVRCIEVDSPDHLFLVTKDFIATHNCHFAQNRDSEAFKVLRTIRPKRLKIGLSATPGGNKFAGIWAVCRWLWPTTMHEDGTPVVDKSKWRWAATWARVEFDPFAGKKITDEKVPGAFVASLPCYIRDEPPKKPYKRFKVQLDATPEQRRQIAQMEEKSVVWLDEHPLVADLPIVQKIRLRQMTLGEVCFNGNDEIDFDIDCKSAKLDACEKIIERHPGEKILFWTDSRKFAQVAAKRLSKLGRLAAAWTGDENAKKRADLKGRFTDPDSDLRFLVVSIAAMAEGVDGMQRVCHTEVWLNRSFNGVHNEQAEGRLNRRGQAADEVVGYFLEMRDTADTEDFARDAKSILTRRKELHHE